LLRAVWKLQRTAKCLFSLTTALLLLSAHSSGIT
jgi:hypothetical protein